MNIPDCVGLNELTGVADHANGDPERGLPLVRVTG